MGLVALVCIPLAAYVFVYLFVSKRLRGRLSWYQKTVLFALPLYSILFVTYVAAGWFRTSGGLAAAIALTGLLTVAVLAVAYVGAREEIASKRQRNKLIRNCETSLMP
jgi:hypothetical protein